MTPRFATDKPNDGMVGNPVSGRHFLLRASRRNTASNLPNIIFGQLRATVTGANRRIVPAFPFSITHVVGVIAEKQVFGIATSRIVAGVKHMHSLGNGAVVDLPRKPMCVEPATFPTDTSVSIARRPGPNMTPARTIGHVNPGSKALNGPLLISTGHVLNLLINDLAMTNYTTSQEG